MNEITLTPAAAERIRSQIERRGHGLGLRLAVRETGCSGYSYVLDYADEAAPDDHLVEAHGVKLFVEADSLPLLQGLTLDFRREGLNELFHFDNPNAEELCGCGESFTTAAPSSNARPATL